MQDAGERRPQAADSRQRPRREIRRRVGSHVSKRLTHGYEAVPLQFGSQCVRSRGVEIRHRVVAARVGHHLRRQRPAEPNRHAANRGPGRRTQRHLPHDGGRARLRYRDVLAADQDRGRPRHVRVGRYGQRCDRGACAELGSRDADPVRQTLDNPGARCAPPDIHRQSAARTGGL